MRAASLLTRGSLLAAAGLFIQTAHFSFAGVDLDSEFDRVAARFPHSASQGQHLSIAPADVHDHVTAIDMSGHGQSRRVRISFEQQRPGGALDYPACERIEAILVRAYGRPTSVLRFTEERTTRADRVWQSAGEEMRLVCFSDKRPGFLAEAVQITRR